MEYIRHINTTITKRLHEKRRFIQVIIGPRQVGKTTAVLQILNQHVLPSHYAAADLPAPPDTAWIARQWDSARKSITRKQGSALLVLDEIQKIHNWSNEVKRCWDEDTRRGTKLHLVLLGSSSLLIQKGLSESLAGRFEILRFPHWSWTECRDCFKTSLDEYLYFGGYPGGLTLRKDEHRWRHYIRDSLIETALSKDILLLNRVEKPALLRQLFVLSCNYSGQILSYQKIMGQLTDAGNTTTLAHYQKLIESAFLIAGLERWSERLIRQRSSSPKWLPLNTGLITSLLNISRKELRHDPQRWGRVVEVAVGAHIMNTGISDGIHLYYWREGNKEVDFVIQSGNTVVAVEVKSGKIRESLSGLHEFTRRYPSAKTLVIGGNEISLVEFLEKPIREWI